MRKKQEARDRYTSAVDRGGLMHATRATRASLTARAAGLVALVVLAAGAGSLGRSAAQTLSSPTGRYWHAMAFDPASGHVVAFGGHDYGTAFPDGALGDTWTWNGVGWTEKSPAASPSARYGMNAAYDVVKHEVVAFGGHDGTNRLGDTWTWNGTTWSQKSPATSPPARNQHAMVYDPVRGQIVLFGGYVTATGGSNATWTWNGTSWSQKSPATSPPARWYHKMAFDAVRGEVVLFGGHDGTSALDDTWTWNGTTWSQKSPATSPPARYVHAMAEDPLRGQVVVFGGYDGTNRLGDTWTWNGTTWSQKFPLTSPPARTQHAMVFDPLLGEDVLFGGTNGSQALDDTWGWNGVTWVERTPSPLPSPTVPPTPSPVPSPSVSPGPLPTVSPGPLPSPTPPLIIIGEYPSDDCAAGMVVADGFAGTTYVKVRSDQPTSQKTRVCFAADGFGEHAGGKVEVIDAGGSPATPTVENDNACTSTPITSGDIGDEGDPDTHAHYEFRVDVNAEDVWVCVSVDDVERRVIVPVSEPPTVVFQPDDDEPHAPGDDLPTDALLPSSACQNNGGDKVVNTDLDSSHLWLYAWEESSTRAHVCLRAEGDDDAGGRLTIDTAGSPGVSPNVDTFTNQASQCNLNVISGDEPVAYSLRRSSATNPAWVCVDVEGTQHQVKLGASTGPQTIVTFTPDDPM